VLAVRLVAGASIPFNGHIAGGEVSTQVVANLRVESLALIKGLPEDAAA
jgi:hypothetical protein